MKLFWLLIIFAQTFQVLSQNPDPQLFRMWYLTFVQSSDKGTPYQVSEISPTIQPNLEFFEDFNFTGDGACNSFSGIAAFPYPGFFEMEIVEFTFDTEDCGFQIHNSFENSYFSFLQSLGSYEITEEGEGLILTFSNPLMGFAIFRDHLLSTTSFNKENISIYPNPFSSTLTIDTKGKTLTLVELYNASGKKAYVKPDPNGHLNLSELKSGIYFLKLESEGTYYVKKILKK